MENERWNKRTGGIIVIFRNPNDPCRFWWPWVTLKRGTQAGQIFQASLCNYARAVCSKTIGTVYGNTCMGRGVFLGVRHASFQRGAAGAPALHNFFGFLLTGMSTPFDVERPKIRRLTHGDGELACCRGSIEPRVGAYCTHATRRAVCQR